MTNLLLHFSKSEVDDLLVLERGEGPYVFDTDGRRERDRDRSRGCHERARRKRSPSMTSAPDITA
jgi:hypothetical protein